VCLRIVWGRIGNRRLRERSEVFADRAALLRRRDELLDRRSRHGYVPSSPAPRSEPRALAEHQPAEAGTHVVERAILEEHGLPIEDRAARALVARWHAATLAIVRYLEGKGAKLLDLVDASMLAGMFVDASAAA
jgi:predicted DNA-binding WGR domain protein